MNNPWWRWLLVPLNVPICLNFLYYTAAILVLWPIYCKCICPLGLLFVVIFYGLFFFQLFFALRLVGIFVGVYRLYCPMLLAMPPVVLLW